MSFRGKKIVTVCDVDGTITTMDKLALLMGDELFRKVIIENDYHFKEIISKIGLSGIFIGFKKYLEYAKNPEFSEIVCPVLKDIQDTISDNYISTSRAFTDKRFFGIYFRHILENSLNKEGLNFSGCNYSGDAYAKSRFCSLVGADLAIEDSPWNASVISNFSYTTVALVHNEVGYSKEIKHKNIINVYTKDELREVVDFVYKKKI